MGLVQQVLRSNGLFARALRGFAWAGSGHILSQVIRLASNLILTRLLFPEAFGLMSLITVLMVGVAMLSDVGIGVSVAQSRRGDERDFLDTAWSLQVLRGISIFLFVLICAWPLSLFYREPAILYLLPAASLSVLISCLNPIRLETAGRHLLLGRVVLADLISQVVTMLITVVAAILIPSVWSLVIGMILGTAFKLLLVTIMIPGEPSRFRIDVTAAREILTFGKWILPSTAFGYLLGQGDRLILGAYLSLEMLGIYNIGQFLAAAPLVLATSVVSKILVPLYREYFTHPGEQSAHKLRLMRFGLTGGVMALLLCFALSGPFIVTLLYDARYAQASAIAVLVALACLPQTVGLTYDWSALAAGDSRSFFFVIAFRGTVQALAFIIGAEVAGLFGALVAQATGFLVGHLALIWLARKHKVWDALHDATYLVVALLITAIVTFVHWDLLYAFAHLNG
ncbi:MAG: oligosaccharide flippase family protein [Candidatus Devosia phytovorans]|uniref:Oligosaccharide flippase family protein n=1 Tax=Candidatus Devosia phytovorans TaxID=3121372 RepID=A0AAJ6B0Q1_9HYPH|nr:oligosaccharide flippase family protein [Devosia sp.]WEK03728.1 MAG: oligosaccharide flippase family protein [Devosia sp.]